MKRQYYEYITEFLPKKMIFITGPRQSGKTTLAGMLKTNCEYLNYDNDDHRQILIEKSWDRQKSLLILDELHKKKLWKRWLKGIFDVEGLKQPIVVTGSAKLDTYRKVGDSLAGRYFQFRLHPLDIKELHRLHYPMTPDAVLERILQVGGFPEPFLEGTERFYHLWKKTHIDIILRQDLLDLASVSDLRSLELLLDLLRKRVGSPLSYSSLAEDLHCSDKTIKRWLELLENVYVVFKIVPYSKNIARSNLRQPKYYFYDCARVLGDSGFKLENAVACSLLKECQFRSDCLGENWELFYLSKRGGIEVDFLLCKDDKPEVMIEVKSSDEKPTRNFTSFAKDLPGVRKVQLVRHVSREKTYPDGSEVRSAAQWLARW